MNGSSLSFKSIPPDKNGNNWEKRRFFWGFICLAKRLAGASTRPVRLKGLNRIRKGQQQMAFLVNWHEFRFLKRIFHTFFDKGFR